MTDHRTVKKAVFPVAGLGTRFLPATKANPKEMLPIVDKPLVQYAVQEAVSAGIETLIFVNGRSKRAIEDHFDRTPELEYWLERKDKHEVLRLVRSIVPERVTCIYIRQPAPNGLGDAVLHAQPALNNEPFVVLLADDLIDPVEGSAGCVSALIRGYQEFDSHVVAVEKISPEAASSYGIMGVGEKVGKFWRVQELVEKPEPENVPGDLAIIGRYLFKPEIFDALRTTDIGTGEELQLTDAIAREARRGGVLAHVHRGKRYDCGAKLGYLQANVEVGMKDPNVGEAFRSYLQSMIKSI